MKILYYSPHPTINMAAPSGPGTHIREIVNAFENKGHTVIKLIAGGELLNADVQPQIQFKRRKIKKFIPNILWQTLKDWKLIQFDGYNKAELVKLIEREKPDLIYERGYYLMSSGFEAAKLFDLPYYCEINAPYPEEKMTMEGNSFFLERANYVEKKQMESATGVFVVSTALKDYLVKKSRIDPKKIVVTPNAVNPKNIIVDLTKISAIKAQLNFTKENCIIGFVGSIFPYHGVDTLLEAFYSLRAGGNKNLRLLIVGDGEILPNLKAYSIEKSLKDVVHFTGNIPHKDVFNYIAAMDITVMARSNWYGSPVKIFEYGALGKKIVAPNVIPVRDVMKSEIDGLLVGDNKSELIKALSRMIDDEEGSNRMAHHFESKVLNNYTWQKIGDTILQQMI